MAQSVNPGAFWLPDEFLTDEDILLIMEEKKKKKNCYGFQNYTDFKNGAGSGFGLSSGDSSESESDQTDYITRLTRKMAVSSLKDGFARNYHVLENNIHDSTLPVSPSSTLCAAGACCCCRKVMSGGNPNSQTPITYPTSAATWDMLSGAASGEALRMRNNREFYNNSCLFPPPPPPRPPPYINHHQSLSHQKLQLAQFEQLRHHHLLMEQQQQQREYYYYHQQHQSQSQNQNQNHVVHGYLRERNSDFVGNRGNNNTDRPLPLSPSTWSHNQPTGSGVQSLYPSHQTVKRESTGTGVFLPRPVRDSSDTRNKQGCSTALVPARVMHALNLNDIGVRSQLRPRFSSDSGTSTMKIQILNDGFSQQSRSSREGYETQLPQEWTY